MRVEVPGGGGGELSLDRYLVPLGGEILPWSLFYDTGIRILVRGSRPLQFSMLQRCHATRTRARAPGAARRPLHKMTFTNYMYIIRGWPRGAWEQQNANSTG